MFTDDMVPNPFQVTFTLILTIAFKKGLNCSGVIWFRGYLRGGEEKGGYKTRGDKLGNRLHGTRF